MAINTIVIMVAIAIDTILVFMHHMDIDIVLMAIIDPIDIALTMVTAIIDPIDIIVHIMVMGSIDLIDIIVLTIMGIDHTIALMDIIHMGMAMATIVLMPTIELIIRFMVADIFQAIEHMAIGTQHAEFVVIN